MNCFRLFGFWLPIAVCAATANAASDWPQFLGPHRNGVYDGPVFSQRWPTQGLPVTWRKPVGHGFAGPVVVGHQLIAFTREGPEETVSCLDSRTGDAMWKFAYATTYQDDFGFDDGPRATPCIYDGRVFTFGAQGLLHCLDLATGQKIWSVDVHAMFDADKGYFGMACSPLVEGDAVLLNVGGPQGAGIVAFDRHDGKLRWKTSNDEASYSSPVAANIGGARRVLFFTRNGLVDLDPATGQIEADYPWHSSNRMSVNAACPLVLGDKVFLSACYGTGAVLLDLHGKTAVKLWSGDDLLSNHYATSVELNGFLYGLHGRTDPGVRPHAVLRCVDLDKRKVCWETNAIGTASVTLAGHSLLILTEHGELFEVAATPDRFHVKGRFSCLSSEVRAFPAIADGFFYARSKNELVCVDLREPHEK